MGKSRIRHEIMSSLHDFQCEVQTGKISAKFAFPADFTGFSGHFPVEPIMPGICQIQCVLELLSKQFQQEVRLVALKRAKFLNKVVPDDVIMITGTAKYNDCFVTGDFIITKKGFPKEITVSRLMIEGECIS